MSGYRSIFLEPDWAHTLYYGWTEASSSADGRVLAKRLGPVERQLVLSATQELGSAERAVEQALADRSAVSETIVHDLSGKISAAGLGARRFSAVPRQQWLLNAATFVIDLAQSGERLLQNMSADTRRRIRKAELAQVPVIVEERPAQPRRERFFDALHRIAREHAFSVARPGILSRMFDDGRAMLLSHEASGSDGAYLMLYRAGDKAYWLHGAGRGTSPDAGQLLHWRAIEQLKSQGVRWYDLGGVPADPANGIHKFKQGFGGDYVSLGNEFVTRTPLMAALRAGANVVRGFRR